MRASVPQFQSAESDIERMEGCSGRDAIYQRGDLALQGIAGAALSRDAADQRGDVILQVAAKCCRRQ